MSVPFFARKETRLRLKLRLCSRYLTPLRLQYCQLLFTDVITKTTMVEFDLQKRYDSLLALLDELLKDESPLSQDEDLLLAIDDNLLQLKLWGNAIRAQDGTLQKITSDEHFAFSVQEMLQEILDHLHNVEGMSRDDEMAIIKKRLGYVTFISKFCRILMVRF